MSGEMKEETKAEQQGEGWHMQYEKAYDKQAIQENKGRQTSVQKGGKWDLDVYAHITSSCDTAAYITVI